MQKKFRPSTDFLTNHNEAHVSKLFDDCLKKFVSMVGVFEKVVEGRISFELAHWDSSAFVPGL